MSDTSDEDNEALMEALDPQFFNINNKSSPKAKTATPNNLSNVGLKPKISNQPSLRYKQSDEWKDCEIEASPGFRNYIARNLASLLDK